jgi:WD40 repeat protein
MEMPMPLTRKSWPPYLGLLALLALPAFGAAQAVTKDTRPPATSPKTGSSAGLPAGAVARLGSTRFRHSGGVRFLGYSGDGRVLLTADSKLLRFWDAQTGKELRRLAIKARPSRNLPFQSGPPAVLSGDGKILVLGFDSGVSTVVEVATGKEQRTFKTEAPQNNNFSGNPSPAPVLSHDGRLLMALDSDPSGIGTNAKIRVWDTTTGKLTRELTPKEKGNGITFTAAALARDGKTLVAAEGPSPNMKNGGKVPASQLRFLDTATGKELRSVPAPAPFLNAVQFSPDGKALAIVAQDGQGVRVLEAATGKERLKLNLKQGNQLPEVLFAADGKTLFTARATGATQWDLQTGNAIRHFETTPEPGNEFAINRFGRAQNTAVALSPDGRTLALPTPAAVALWDVRTGKEVPGGEGHRARIEFVTFGPAGRQLLTGSADGALYLWDVTTGRRVQEFVVKTPDANAGGPRGGMEMFNVSRVRGQFSPDGKSIAGLWPGGKIQVWDMAGKRRFELGAARGHTSFTYSPDARFVAANGSGGSLLLWDAATGRQIRQFTWMPKAAASDQPGRMRMEEGAYSAAFSPDGRVLLSGAMLVEDRGLKVLVQGWEMASGRQRLQRETSITFDERGPGSIEDVMRALDSFIVSFVFSPDGRLLAEAGLSSVKLSDLHNSRALRVFGGRQVSANTAVFSPDSKYLLAGQQDGTIRLWDVATATVLVDFPAHTGPVTALAFSPDGKLLASGAKDTTLLLWDWAHLRQQVRAPKAAPPPAAREALWADLAADDAPRADRAIQALTTTPGATVALLKPRLRAVAPVDPARLQKLLADLDNKQYAVRQQAEKELAKLGDLAAKAIKDRLAASPSLETGRRLGQLLERLEGGTVPPEVVRALRAVEVLERIGTPKARQVLEGLARGAAGHRVTEEARLSLERLSKRAP